MDSTIVEFGDCRLDLAREQLSRADSLVRLRPKTLSLLQLFLAQPDRALGKAELLARLWPNIAVSEAVLTVCISELREALGDDAREPRYIATVHGRGYRFVARVRQLGDAPVELRPARGSAPRVSSLVGRERELGRLISSFEGALRSGTHMCLVSGEAGIGKTALIREFLAHVRRDGRADIALGQCLATFGAGEPYLPLLSAMQALATGEAGARVRTLLYRLAPMWLMQMPTLLVAQDEHALRARVAGAAPQRMLRELTDALVEITRERPLVLVCEDLHDADPSTIALLTALMQRREARRLLVLVTYRPCNALPLRTMVAELSARAACESIALTPLAEPDVAHFLAVRIPETPVDPELSRALHRRCAGNPLFLERMVEHVLRTDHLVVRSGVLQLAEDLATLGVPATLEPLIALQLERLDAVQREVLAAASVCGPEFAIAGVLACLRTEQRAEAERVLSELAAQARFVRAVGTLRWPDGTRSATFAFRHALEHELVYARIEPARRRLMHRRLAARLARAHAREPAPIAAELALHLERGGRLGLAAERVADAALGALLRSAQPEALAYANRGLMLLAQAGEERRSERTELRIRLVEGAAQLVLQGFGGAEAERAYRRAHVLSARVSDLESKVPTLVGLWHYALTRAHYDEATEVAHELRSLADAHPEHRVLRLQADNTVYQTRLYRGEPAAIHEVGPAAIALYHPDEDRHLTGVYGADPGVLCRLYLAFGSALLGRPLAGRVHMSAAQHLADDLDLPFARTQVLFTRAIIAHVAGNAPALAVYARALAAIAERHNFWQAISFGRLFMALDDVTHGDAKRGAANIAACVAEREQVGLGVLMPHALAVLAGAEARIGKLDDALQTIGRSRRLALATGEQWYLAEIHRLEADILAVIGAPDAEVEASLLSALSIAQAQHARPFAKRAARALSLRGASAIAQRM